MITIRKKTGLVLLVCLVVLLLGAGMMVTAGFLGFKNFYLSTDAEAVILETRNEIPAGEIHSVVLRPGGGTIRVERGTDFSVLRATEGDSYESTVVDGVWTISCKELGHKGGNRIGDFYLDDTGVYLEAARSVVCITIPRDMELEQLAIDIHSGEVQVEGVTCRTLNLTMETGTVDFTACVSKYAFIANEAGRITGALYGTEEDYHMVLESDLGRVKVGNRQLGPLTDKDFHGSKETVDMKVDNIAGSVELRFNGIPVTER